jgi:hypothetical protein
VLHTASAKAAAGFQHPLHFFQALRVGEQHHAEAA